MITVHVIGSRGIPATWGGVEKQCEELYSRLVKFGYNVTIFARSNYVKENIKEWMGVRIIRLPTVPLKGFEAAIHTFLSTIVSLFQRPHIIHYYSQGPCLFSWIPRVFLPKTRVFFTCGGLDWQRKKWRKIESLIIKLGEVFSAKFPHYKIAVSLELKKYYESKYGCDVHYIPNGVTLHDTNIDLTLRLDKFGIKPKEYFLSVSRIVPEKRIEDIIKAYRLAHLRYPLVIVGDTGGHTNDYFQTLKSIAGYDDKIKFLGFRFGEELDQLFRNARCFVTASELEGLPITLLEAMSYGLPCIASDIPPHREILGELNEFVFKLGDIKALSELLVTLQDLPLDEIRQLKEKFIDRVRRDFSWEKAVALLSSLYKKSLRSHI